MSRTHSRDLAEQGHKPVVAGLWMNGVLAAAKKAKANPRALATARRLVAAAESSPAPA